MPVGFILVWVLIKRRASSVKCLFFKTIDLTLNGEFVYLFICAKNALDLSVCTFIYDYPQIQQERFLVTLKAD